MAVRRGLQHFSLGGSKMNGKSAVAMAIGLTLGFAASICITRQPEAQGQEKPKKQQWEYKVVSCSLYGNKGLLPDRDAAKALTEQYNTLAADGWEYVGPVVEKTLPAVSVGASISPQSYQGISGTFVLFRRSTQ
jgi:hypothetical protein